MKIKTKSSPIASLPVVKAAVNIFASSDDLDMQENFTASKISNLNKINYKLINTNRPKDSYINLIKWVEENFGDLVCPKQHIMNKFIHNTIIIDGQFIQFCSENKVEIDSLYNDSIVSWKSECDSERFFIQGIFLIKKNNFKFLHFALFHKGNQNEDEISFCILVDNENTEEYLKFRNKYSDWSSKRDRDNLHIRVVDGEDIPYERDLKWDDVFLPEDLKSNIRLTIEGFLKSKEMYNSQKIPWKRGLLLYGTAGCGKTSLIKTIISNYDFKPITVLPGANDDSMREAFLYAQEQNPALLFFEDLDSLLQNVNLSLFLNLLDGISSKNGVFVIATANNLSSFAANIKDRPSRFDRKFEIPLPNEDMSVKYIKKWFDNILSDEEIKKIATITVKHKFSYAYIKDIYISSVYIAIADNRKQPNIQDINLAMEQLMADKLNKSPKVVGIDKYLDRKDFNKKK